MEVQNIIGWSFGLMLLSIIIAGITPSATTILFAMTMIGILMMCLAVGVMREKAPAIDPASAEKNYGPMPDED